MCRDIYFKWYGNPDKHKNKKQYEVQKYVTNCIKNLRNRYYKNTRIFTEKYNYKIN